MEPAKPRILFVDDEPNVLNGLRLMLRNRRIEWDMDFASSGAEALEMMAKQPFEVIVSDMRMPEMPGEVLLAEVQQKYPATARIVLSGQADRESILKSVGPIHQYLQKPCDEQTLHATISRTCELRSLFCNEDLQAMIGEIESLPGLPALQQELMSKLQLPNVSPNLIGETIARDIGMTAKILQLVNSAFFGLRRHIVNPTDAVKLLGLETIKSLVLTMQVFSRVSSEECKCFSQDMLLAHSAEVAQIAKQITSSQTNDERLIEMSYLAGLLHDVGKLVLASQRPQQFCEAITITQNEDIPVTEAEERIFGATHAQIGGYLLGLWGFDPQVVDAAAFHHCPARSVHRNFCPMIAVHIANTLVHDEGKSSSVGNKKSRQLDIQFLREAELEESLHDWISQFDIAEQEAA